MVSSNFLYAIVGGFMVGVVAANFYILDWLLLIWLAVGLFLILPLVLSAKNYYLVTTLILLGVALGVFRYQMLALIESGPLPLGQVVRLTGSVAAEPDQREARTQLRLKITGRQEKVLLIVPRHPEYSYGDVVEVAGKLVEPKNFTTDADREFDYINYLKKDGIWYLMYEPHMTLISSGGGNLVVKRLLIIKRSFLEATARQILEPGASLLAGLVVGARQGMGNELNNDFRRVGLSHIVVLSGYNLSVVAGAILKTLSFLPLRLALVSGAAGIVAFAIMVGGGATVVRASIMALLVIVARATGRIYDVTVALIVAAFLMVLWNPQLLVADLGFQLSFLATLGIIYGVPLIEPKLSWLPGKLGIREAAATTIAAQLAVLPWLLYKIGELSIVALPVNMLVLSIIPATMLAGFITGVLGMLWAPLAFLPGLVTQALLNYILLVTKFFSTFPLAAVAVPEVSAAIVFIIYLILVWFMRKLSLKYVSEKPASENTLEMAPAFPDSRR